MLDPDDIQIEDVTFQTEKIGHYRTITHISQAAEQLLYHWPVKTGEKWYAAQRACYATLERKLSPGAARAAFIDACEEAGIFVIPNRLRPPSTGKAEHWHKSKPRRRS
ncbi:DUF982 domain-containing protein [Phyllobacterium sp. LjRoot231]|uniref:DUF982 domain-containing protein n=1 Tax=Phyllobacterium sp. LjRoot231 TaxID=3342289 RepID=UPI003ECD6E7B